MENVKTIENTKISTVEDMINAEIAKIEAGYIDESNVLKFAYLNEIVEELAQNWKTFNSSREREEAQYTWRAVSNELNWVETILMESKLKTLYDTISTIESTRKVIMPNELLAQKLVELKNQKNAILMEYADRPFDYEKIVRERQMYKDEGLYDYRADLTPTEIVKVVNELDDEQKIKFWQKYFVLADKYIEPKLPNSRLNNLKQMGE